MRRVNPTGATATLFALLITTCTACNDPHGTIRLTEDFEDQPTAAKLPDGWELIAKSGAYRARIVSNGFSGKRALVVAGSGGLAELRSPIVTTEPQSTIMATGWVRPSEFGKGNCTIGVMAIEATGSASKFIPISPVETKWNDWQWFRWCQTLNASEGHWGLKLDGEGAIRLDALKVDQISIRPEYQLNDGDFELADRSSTAGKWDINSDVKNTDVQIVTDNPFSGKACLRLQAKGKWLAYTSTLEIPSNVNHLLFQGVGRARAGSGQLKIEYWKEGQFQDAGFSDPCENSSWEFQSIVIEPEKAALATTIRVAVSASTDTAQFDVDFDDLKVFVW